jgi:hypothetical protein
VPARVSAVEDQSAAHAAAGADRAVASQTRRAARRRDITGAKRRRQTSAFVADAAEGPVG